VTNAENGAVSTDYESRWAAFCWRSEHGPFADERCVDGGSPRQCDHSASGDRCDVCGADRSTCGRCDGDGYLPDSTLSKPVYCPDCPAGDFAWVKDHPSGPHNGRNEADK
jgi:hypothetical protein